MHKNITFLSFTEPFFKCAEDIRADIEAHAFNNSTKIGFVPALGLVDMPLVHEESGFLAFCLREDSPVLPTAAVTKMVNEHIEALEKEQGNKISYAERRIIKKQIVAEMTNKAFWVSKYTQGYIDMNNQLLVIDASSSKQAETLMSALREALGFLPVTAPQTQLLPSALMTGWVKNDMPPRHFQLNDCCELRTEINDASRIKVKEISLYDPSLKAHLLNGMVVQSLSMDWHERLSFTLTETLQIKQIKYKFDLDFQYSDEEETDNSQALAAFEFKSMAVSLSAMMHELLIILSGEK